MSLVAAGTTVRGGLRVLLVVLASVLSAIALARYHNPWGWCFFTWAGMASLEAALHRRVARFLLVNLAVALATLAAVETAWGFSRARPLPSPLSPNASGDSFFVADPVLGYAGAPNVSTHQELRSASHTWDATYTTGADGLRVAPPCECAPGTPSILFFGCSFTFGQGVEDDETMPYRTGVLLGGRYAVYNFGMIAYGPHHMLAAVEHGRVRRIVRQEPRYAIYTLITDHVRRVAGESGLNRVSPRYVSTGDGGVVYAGSFESRQPLPREGLAVSLRRQLAKSAVLQRVAPALVGFKEDLTIDIVAESRRRLAEAYPEIELHVVFWDEPNPSSRYLAAALEQRGFPVHRVSEVLPDYRQRWSRYHLPEERHPSAEAYDLIARYLVSDVITAR